MSVDVLLVAGARPNFVKLAPLYRALQSHRTYLTLRKNTERPVTITEGTNQLVEPERASFERALQCGKGAGSSHTGTLGRAHGGTDRRGFGKRIGV